MTGRALKGVVVAAWLVATASLAGCSPLASKGTMPPPGSNGQVDASAAPDFIAVAGRDGGIAGYVPKMYLFPDQGHASGRAEQPGAPVYGDDLLTLVGHMVAGRGFVPLGVDPQAVSTIAVQVAPSTASSDGRSSSLTLYVRNPAASTAWFAIAGTAVGATGFNGIGVGCIDVDPGGRLVLLDRAPQDADARVLRVLIQTTQANETPTLWVDIALDGAVSQGTGVPPWWVGDPQRC
jgi:hypothetical protein